MVSFTGVEPLLHLRELAHLIRYAGRVGIDYIRTGTNGFAFARPDRPGSTEPTRKPFVRFAASWKGPGASLPLPLL